MSTLAPEQTISSIWAFMAAQGLTFEQFTQGVIEAGLADAVVFDDEPIATDADVPRDAPLSWFVDHAHQSLSQATARAHASGLRFMADGWTIAPDQYDDAASVLKQLKKKVPPLASLTTRTDEHGNERLVMWDGYGERPVRLLGRTHIDRAIPQKRAATLTEQLRRARMHETAGRTPPTSDWTGNGSIEKLIVAMRWVYAVARGSGLVRPDFAPAADLELPPRDDPKRREMTVEEVVDIGTVIDLHSPYPRLWATLFRFHLWTAHRPIAAMNLLVGGIDLDRCVIGARTKYGKWHEVPAPRELCDELLALAASRGSTEPDDPVFRTKNRAHSHDGLAHLNRHVYERMHDLVRKHLAWAREEGWTIYWTRHHAKAQICDIGGFDCGIALLGHTEKSAIERYGKASVNKLAWAVSVMTGQPHPLAVEPTGVRARQPL